MGHTELVRQVAEQLGEPGWDAQAVATSFERARGKRAVGERIGGDGFVATASKTMAASAERSASHGARSGRPGPAGSRPQRELPQRVLPPTRRHAVGAHLAGCPPRRVPRVGASSVKPPRGPAPVETEEVEVRAVG